MSLLFIAHELLVFFYVWQYTSDFIKKYAHVIVNVTIELLQIDTKLMYRTIIDNVFSQTSMVRFANFGC